jgi:hypothetical protein
MDYDLILTLGMVLLALSLPSFLGAWVEGRLSRSGVFMVVLAVGMIGWAVHSRPEAYRFQQLPDVVLGVIGRMIN